MARRRCVDWDETAAHEHQRGALVGDSPKTTKYRKTKTVRRERREGQDETRNWRKS